ncbi:MAG: hypothetical protein ACFFC7_21450 [Candidatus Hermodarchaeota archaeon]
MLLANVSKTVKIAYRGILAYYNDHRSPLLIAILSLLVIFFPLFALVMMYVGWKYGSSYGIKTAGYLSLLHTLLVTLVERPMRLDWLLPIHRESGFVAQDWYSVIPPTCENFIFNFIDLILVQALLVDLAFFIMFALIGAGLYHIKAQGLKRSSIPKNYLFLAKCGLLLFCFLLVTAIWSPSFWAQSGYLKPYMSLHPSPFNLNELMNQPMPLPDHPASIYEFVVPVSYHSLQPPLSQYRTVIPEFGNIDFILKTRFRLNFQPSGGGTLAVKGTLTPLNESEPPATASESNFSLLGAFYLPNSFNGRSWRELIGKEINSSFPFNGFTPVPDTETIALEWRLKGKLIDLPVNTIQYRSLTNNSVYTLSFDKRTGWLMKGTFYKSVGSWVEGTQAQTFIIDRYFMVISIDNTQYYLLDLGLMICVILPSTLFLIASFLYYHNRGKGRGDLGGI